MKQSVKNLFGSVSLLLICLTVSLILIFAGQGAVEDTPIRKKDVTGITVNAVSILDVKGVMNMTAFNYLPNEFAELGETVSDENAGDTPAKRGTYRLYIDTLTMEEWDQSESLNHLLKPDGSWHLTMYIPPVFSACSVYVQYQNQEYVGSIDRYNIEYYTNYSSPSEFDDSVSHQTATQPLLIDIPISSDNKYSRECIVTIHYETDNANFVGIKGDILIGEESANIVLPHWRCPSINFKISEPLCQKKSYFTDEKLASRVFHAGSSLFVLNFMSCKQLYRNLQTYNIFNRLGLYVCFDKLNSLSRTSKASPSIVKSGTI